MLEQTLNFKITQAQESKISQVDWENLPFGRHFSDHMLVMEYRDGEWQNPEITPFGTIPFHPATSAVAVFASPGRVLGLAQSELRSERRREAN